MVGTRERSVGLQTPAMPVHTCCIVKAMTPLTRTRHAPIRPPHDLHVLVIRLVHFCQFCRRSSPTRPSSSWRLACRVRHRQKRDELQKEKGVRDSQHDQLGAGLGLRVAASDDGQLVEPRRDLNRLLLFGFCITFITSAKAHLPCIAIVVMAFTFPRRAMLCGCRLPGCGVAWLPQHRRWKRRRRRKRRCGVGMYRDTDSLRCRGQNVAKSASTLIQVSNQFCRQSIPLNSTRYR